MERLRVLVIDDSLTIRALVEELVSHDPAFDSATVAPDIPSARLLIASLRPHVITLDLVMPGIGGLGFLDELRGQPHAPIVVVASSTRAGSAARKEALDRGADFCFDKAELISGARRFVRLLKLAARRGAIRSAIAA